MTIISKVENVIIIDAEYHEEVRSIMTVHYWFIGCVGTLFHVQDKNYYAYFVPRTGGSVMLEPGPVVESAR